jgi:hypothetical protein
MQKWEYCVITGVDFATYGITGSYPKLSYFSINGVAKEIDLGNSAASKRPSGMQKVSEGGYIASIIASLGQEGWEMVGVVNASSTGTGTHGIYFRRPME